MCQNWASLEGKALIGNSFTVTPQSHFVTFCKCNKADNNESMRLKQIKLAGFKSFVDPTQVPFPAAMTCVVGPNGCGKSNVIDAVRWVLGESSAKNLRGDAMTDVIFNGSTQRKPVSQASVELVFENTQGKLQGSLADRSEISLKRLVTRDAQSHYFLNGSKCRRRDITDIFLGTGLGPRSYAIIEQGMISRLIESRPQELRVFIEEAAGISKYKERRRETETRIKHTRDNLDRLADVRDELGKNLDKLRRQAATAERYKELKATERRYKAELTCLKWLFYNNQLQQAEQQLAALELDFTQFETQGSGGFLRLTELKAELDNVRQQLDAKQQQYYQLGVNISALEQQLLHQRQRRQTLQDEKRSLTLNLQHGLDQISEEQAQLAALQQQLLEQLPDTELVMQQLEEVTAELLLLEQQQQDQQQAQLAAQQQQFQWQQQLRQLELQSEHKKLLLQQNVQRQQKLSEQQQSLAAVDIAGNVSQLMAALADTEQLQTKCSEETKLQSDRLGELQQQKIALQLKAQSVRQQQQQLGSALAAVEKEQQKLLQQQPLLPKLQVAEGWSVAVAVALSALNFSEITQGHQCDAAGHYLFASGKPLQTDSQNLQTGASLASKVSGALMPAYFADILLADDEQSAVAMLKSIAPYQSVMLQNGHWYGANWRIVAGKNEQDNPQALAERASQLTAEMTVAMQQLTAVECEQQLLQQQRQLQEETLQQLQGRVAVLQTQQQQQHTELVLLQQQQQQQQLQLHNMAEELAQLTAQQQLDVEMLELWQQQQLEVQAELAAHQDLQQDVQAKLAQSQQQLQQWRSRQQQLNQQQQQQALNQVSLERQLEAARTHLARSQQQQQQLADKLQSLSAQLDLLDEPNAEDQEQLHAWLLEREELAAVKLQLQNQQSGLEQQLRETEQGQHGLQQLLASKQKQIDNVRLDAEGFRIRANNMLELLSEQKVNFRDLQQNLPPDATEPVWQQQLDKTTEALNRLGPINLAAIDEFAQQDERKQYLDAQHQDLVSALETLETAIRKIDRETRQKFKETYEQVNSGLQSLFPKVFGGGSAYLELTDEDLLETGVSIMARPPGKKNSTIHLLSGGEKALTALSLVFSIFRLNPAPFCMLDEVDAPLDDANVGRFCNLVREMSETVQFIYISHNKIAMEMAAQLMGVTMQEPGVSRVVAVDVEDAVKMAQA